MEAPVTTARERRIGRRMESRGERPLFDSLLELRGIAMNDGYYLGDLVAVGGEGAIYDVRNVTRPRLRLVGKVALIPWHRPIRLTSRVLRAQRENIEAEARVLEEMQSGYMPRSLGITTFTNPLSEKERGGAFAASEPCLVLERLRGYDLDVWLCQVHRGYLEWVPLRRVLDRIALEMLRALADLERRGFICADLRPGNVRVMGRPDRTIRLLDAGSCVRIGDKDAAFPHVPSYLPPGAFWASEAGERLVPSVPTHATMAGRTLFEIATGESPQAGSEIDADRVRHAPVSAPIAEVIAALSRGDFSSCREALDAMSEWGAPVG